MCFNPFKIIDQIFSSLFGGPPPTGPDTHAKGLVQKLRRPDSGDVEDTDLKKEKGETKTDLSQSQSEALKRVADSTKQTDKAKQNQADLMAALSGVGEAPTGGLTSPTGTTAPKGGGGAGY